MPEIVHPRLPRDRRIVPASALKDWLAAGWKRATGDEPEPPEVVGPVVTTTDPDPAPTTRRSRPRRKKE